MEKTVTQIVTLPILSVGFCVDITGEEKLRKAGLSKIWRRGNGAESLEDAIAEFRGRPGALVVSDDLRIFGLTQKEIFARCSALADMEIKVANVNHPGENIHDLQRRAFGALHAAAPIRDHRTARRRGRQGGLAKAAAAQAARDGRCSPDIVARLCQHPALTWEDCAGILGPHFSTSTLQRIC
jgi:hypothetical protein